MASNDNDLRSLFEELRREDEARTPVFTLTRPSRMARGSRLGRLVVLAASLAGLVACVFFLRLMRQPERLPGTPAVSLTEWKAPTDFLLETPGRELLRTVPAIGDWRERRQQPKRPHTVKQLQP
jgi:hypothetical protein